MSVQKVPYISIIVPVYNAENYLETCIKSILDQSFDNFELIMVDDCSSDYSLEICRCFERTDARIKVIHAERNAGAGAARNIGISLARGTYLTFVDSDDTIDKDILRKAAQKAAETESDLVVWGMVEEYYAQDGRLSYTKTVKPEKMNGSVVDSIWENVISLEKRTLLGYQCNKLYRLAIIRNNDIRFEHTVLYEDYFFTMAVLRKSTTIAVVPEVGYHYAKRMNNSLTTQFVADYFSLSRRRVREMLDFYLENDKCTSEVEKILASIYVRYVVSAIQRNFEKNSGMKHADRKKWLSELYRDGLWEELTPYLPMDWSMLGILSRLLVHRRSGCVLVLGKFIYLMRKAAPVLFSKIKGRA